MEESRGRRARQVARRYVEGLAQEQADLRERIAALERALDDEQRHHRERHPECARPEGTYGGQPTGPSGRVQGLG